MYPRNAASPPRLSIGAVVQISDGAVQTSGVSVKVRPEGGTASAGGGTTAYEEGIVLYTPTQAETNYTAFVVIAYKTGCVPVALPVVTTAMSTSGQVYVGTNNDKTGYSLTATTGLGNQTANITGTLSGSVGSVGTGGITAASFAAGAINAAAIANDAIDSAALATDVTARIGDAVLDEVVEGAYTLRQLIRLVAASLGSKLSGAATTTISVRDLGDSKNRIVATVDADGNRSAITLDLT
jgi:hypothetical protein